MPKKSLVFQRHRHIGILTRTKTQVRGGAVKKPGGFQPDLVRRQIEREIKPLLRSA